MRPTRIRDKEMYEDEYTESEFEGTYVQDEEGQSDDDIYDALDGDSEDYWYRIIEKYIEKYFCGL